MDKVAEILVEAAEVLAGDRDDLQRALMRSRDNGVSGVVRLILRLWDVDVVDWRATEREILKMRDGRSLLRRLESLPYFSRIVDGEYREVIDELGSDAEDMVRKWDFVMSGIQDDLEAGLIDLYSGQEVP